MDHNYDGLTRKCNDARKIRAGHKLFEQMQEWVIAFFLYVTYEALTCKLNNARKIIDGAKQVGRSSNW